MRQAPRVRFDPPLIPGLFVRRYKRFFADVLLPDGSTVVAHCANPGSMRSCLFEGARVWLSPNQDPRRKLRYTWQLLEAPDGWVLVNPMLANDLVAEALVATRIAELSDYPVLRREVRVGEASRIDFVLERPGARCFVEVKNVSLAVTDQRAAFPDSVTERGTRHLRDLMQLRSNGERAVLMFHVGRESALSVEPADDIDALYGATLREAARCGVEVLAYGCEFTQHSIELCRRIPVHL
jgi:sugar fermentation stimulation protein A